MVLIHAILNRKWKKVAVNVAVAQEVREERERQVLHSKGNGKTDQDIWS